MNERLLIIEDDQSLGSLLTESLARNNIVFDWAHDGEEALAFCKDHTYKIMLLDIMLPKKDGFEVLKELARAGNKTPVIVMTILTTDEVSKRLSGYPIEKIFIKSQVSIFEIVDYVATAIRGAVGTGDTRKPGDTEIARHVRY